MPEMFWHAYAGSLEGFDLTLGWRLQTAQREQSARGRPEEMIPAN